jgi:hypothetical protein
MPAVEILINMLKVEPEKIAMQAAKALGAMLLSAAKNKDIAHRAQDSLLPLLTLSRSSNIAVVEMAATAFANLLVDINISRLVPAEDLIGPLTRVLYEGTYEGKERAACALALLLRSRSIDDTLSQSVQRSGTVVALVELLADSDIEKCTKSETLEALATLVSARYTGTSRPPWTIIAEAPGRLEPLVSCVVFDTPLMQERAIEVLSRICQNQPVVLGDLIAGTSKCISALVEHIINSSRAEVKVGGTALLVCALKEHRQQAMEALNKSLTFTLLTQSLINMIGITAIDYSHSGEVQNSFDPDEKDTSNNNQHNDIRISLEHATLDDTAALWLLSIIACQNDDNKVAIVEGGAIELLIEKLNNRVSNTLQVMWNFPFFIFIGVA